MSCKCCNKGVDCANFYPCGCTEQINDHGVVPEILLKDPRLEAGESNSRSYYEHAKHPDSTIALMSYNGVVNQDSNTIDYYYGQVGGKYDFNPWEPSDYYFYEEGTKSSYHIPDGNNVDTAVMNVPFDYIASSDKWVRKLNDTNDFYDNLIKEECNDDSDISKGDDWVEVKDRVTKIEQDGEIIDLYSGDRCSYPLSEDNYRSYTNQDYSLYLCLSIDELDGNDFDFVGISINEYYLVLYIRYNKKIYYAILDDDQFDSSKDDWGITDILDHAFILENAKEVDNIDFSFSTYYNCKDDLMTGYVTCRDNPVRIHKLEEQCFVSQDKCFQGNDNAIFEKAVSFDPSRKGSKEELCDNAKKIIEDSYEDVEEYIDYVTSNNIDVCEVVPEECIKNNSYCKTGLDLTEMKVKNEDGFAIKLVSNASFKISNFSVSLFGVLPRCFPFDQDLSYLPCHFLDNKGASLWHVLLLTDAFVTVNAIENEERPDGSENILHSENTYCISSLVNRVPTIETKRLYYVGNDVHFAKIENCIPINTDIEYYNDPDVILPFRYLDCTYNPSDFVESLSDIHSYYLNNKDEILNMKRRDGTIVNVINTQYHECEDSYIDNSCEDDSLGSEVGEIGYVLGGVGSDPRIMDRKITGKCSRAIRCDNPWDGAIYPEFRSPIGVDDYFTESCNGCSPFLQNITSTYTRTKEYVSGGDCLSSKLIHGGKIVEDDHVPSFYETDPWYACQDFGPPPSYVQVDYDLTNIITTVESIFPIIGAMWDTAKDVVNNLNIKYEYDSVNKRCFINYNDIRLIDQRVRNIILNEYGDNCLSRMFIGYGLLMLDQFFYELFGACCSYRFSIECGDCARIGSCGPDWRFGNCIYYCEDCTTFKGSICTNTTLELKSFEETLGCIGIDDLKDLDCAYTECSRYISTSNMGLLAKFLKDLKFINNAGTLMRAEEGQPWSWGIFKQHSATRYNYGYSDSLNLHSPYNYPFFTYFGYLISGSATPSSFRRVPDSTHFEIEWNGTIINDKGCPNSLFNDLTYSIKMTSF